MAPLPSKRPAPEAGPETTRVEDEERPAKRFMSETLRERSQRHYNDLRVVLEKTINGRYRDGGSYYDHVGVLLICWEDDDLPSLAKEISSLEAIFRDRFHFDVEIFRIPSEKTLTTLNHKVAEFAHKYDSPSDLAILYYGGHSKSEDSRLRLYAREKPNGEGDPSAFFEDVVYALHHCDTDVLIITDCCYSTSAFAEKEVGKRKFELLTATGPHQGTPALEGPYSFTRHLRETLESLADDQGGFTTSKLYRKLYFKSEAQFKPFLFDQSTQDWGRILLQPLRSARPSLTLADPTNFLKSSGDEDSNDGDTILNMQLRLRPKPKPHTMNELARAMQSLPHVKLIKFERMYAPKIELEGFMRGVVQVMKLRPLVARLREKIEARRMTEGRDTKTDIHDVTYSKDSHVSREPSHMYNWSKSKLEMGPPQKMVKPDIRPPPTSTSRQSVRDSGIDIAEKYVSALGTTPAVSTGHVLGSSTSNRSILVAMQRHIGEGVLNLSTSWEWLVNRVSITERLTHWDTFLLDQVCSSLQAPVDDRVNAHCVVFNVSWNPLRFLREEFTDRPDIRLRDVICITGSAEGYFCCRCSEHVIRIWPSLNTQLVDALQMAMDSNMTGNFTLDTGCALNLSLHGDDLRVEAQGSLPFVVEVGEQLAWLGAACSASPSTRSNCYRRAIINTPSRGDKPTVDVEYTIQPLPNHETADCWRHLFKAASIAADFPIPLRDKEAVGMECSLDVMLVLGECPWATVFEDKFMLKGHSSICYPTSATDSQIVWHFAYTPGQKYLPYIAGKDSCMDRSAYRAGNTAWLRETRHFIGWASSVLVHMGSADGIYNVTEPQPSSHFSNLQLERINISGGQYITLGGAVARGRHHIPLWSAPYSEYVRDIAQASEESVLLYDPHDKRAWLVSATSALLHLCIAQMKGARESKFWDKSALSQLKFADCEDPEACLNALMDEQNRRLVLLQDDFGHEKDIKLSDLEERKHLYRFQHLVHDNWKRLAQILEQHALKPAAMELRFTTRERLAGWSFAGLIKSKPLMSPKIYHVMSKGKGCGWVPFVKTINAAVLVGKGFGNVISPCQTAANICQHWKTVPTSLENLTVTIHKLRQIAESQGYSFPDELAKNVKWKRHRDPFAKCRCKDHSRTKCDRYQILSTGSLRSPAKTKVDESLCDQGAVIFGNCGSRSRSIFEAFKGTKVTDSNSDAHAFSTPSGHGSDDAVSTSSRRMPTDETADLDSSLVTESREGLGLHEADSDVDMQDEEEEEEEESSFRMSGYRSFVYDMDRPTHNAQYWMESPTPCLSAQSIAHSVHEFYKRTKSEARFPEPTGN